MFLAHKNELQENDWMVLPQSNETKTLVNKGDGFELQHNLCLHQGTKLRTGRGSGTEVTCPYHAWSWDKDGAPIGSGNTGHSKGTIKCENTQKIPFLKPSEWSGFLFESPIQLGIDVSGDYRLEEYRKDDVNANFIPLMNHFLDIDHFSAPYADLYSQIDIPDVQNVEWRSWQGGSAQLVRGAPGTNAEWNQHLPKQTTFSAVWLALYPFTMIEWQPGALFVAVNQPIDDSKTTTHIFKYRDYNYNEETWKINNRVWEAVWQKDRETAQLLEPGWRFHTNNLDQEKTALKAFIEKSGLA
jgi:phenylpropionate dioxygenase-like ring-hydroxylating dioxygenase large terminal subunit